MGSKLSTIWYSLIVLLADTVDLVIGLVTFNRYWGSFESLIVSSQALAGIRRVTLWTILKDKSVSKSYIRKGPKRMILCLITYVLHIMDTVLYTLTLTRYHYSLEMWYYGIDMKRCAAKAKRERLRKEAL